MVITRYLREGIIIFCLKDLKINVFIFTSFPPTVFFFYPVVNLLVQTEYLKIYSAQLQVRSLPLVDTKLTGPSLVTDVTNVGDDPP